MLSCDQGRRKYLKLGGGTALRGHFFLKKKGAFIRLKSALLCLLQNLGGAHAPSAPPVPTSLRVIKGEEDFDVG